MHDNQAGWRVEACGRGQSAACREPLPPRDSSNTGFIHENVYRRLRSLIVSGALARGARVASSRKLAADLQISRNSVLTALDRLVADGWVEARNRSGLYVSYSGPRVAPPATTHFAGESVDASPFALGWASDVFPVQIWKRLQSRRWRNIPETLLERGDSKGLAALRAAIAAHVTLRHGFGCSPDQIFVVTCIPAAIDLAIGAGKRLIGNLSAAGAR